MAQISSFLLFKKTNFNLEWHFNIKIIISINKMFVFIIIYLYPRVIVFKYKEMCPIAMQYCTIQSNAL